MKKILLSLVAMLAGLTAQATDFTVTSEEIVSGKTGTNEMPYNGYGSQSTSDKTTWYTFAKSGINFSGAKICQSSGSSGVGIQFQGNASDAAKQGFIGNTTSMGKISQIVVKLNTLSTSTYAPSFNVCVGSSEMPTTAVTLPVPTTDTKTVSEKTYKTYTYTIAVTGSNGYFAIRDNLSGAIYLDEIDVTYENGGGTTKKSAGLTWSQSAITYIKGETFTAPTFTQATTATVSFTTDDDEVATVDANGVITLKGGVGPVNITASSPENDEYEAGTATCTITVNSATDVTCAQAADIAKALTANNTPAEGYYSITGYVTDTNGSVSKGQQIFWMADTKDGGKVFEGYWANIPDATKPLNVGDKIKMVGQIMKYNTTYEMKNGNVTVLERAVVKVDTIESNAHDAYIACKALESGAYSTDVYKITAYVDAVTYNYSNGTQSFTLTDTKGTKGDSLVVYKTKISEAALVGAKVCVVGKLQNYSNTTMEIASGSTTTILEQGITAVSTVNAASATEPKAVKFFKEGQVVIMKAGKTYNAAGQQMK